MAKPFMHINSTKGSKQITKMGVTSVLSFALVFLIFTGHCYCDLLRVGFYQGKCGPNDIEKIIHEKVGEMLKDDPDVVSDLTRLVFHDCFVRGCDASVFLDGYDTEKTAVANQDLAGFETVDEIKATVEHACPEVVSCVDVLVMAARSAASLAGGKYFEVETGRRDGFVSRKDDIVYNIPPPTISIPDVIGLFASKGLSIEDLVVLLGAHTAGVAHCHSFKARLYNFQNTKKPDSRISPALLQLLQNTCPLTSQADNEAFLDQTPNSNFTFDNAYYKQIISHNGIMEIDENIASDPVAGGIVRALASYPDLFPYKFGISMNKMARIGVLTGKDGEIRRSCRAVNTRRVPN